MAMIRPVGLRCAGAPLPWGLHSGPRFSAEAPRGQASRAPGYNKPLARPTLGYLAIIKTVVVNMVLHEASSCTTVATVEQIKSRDLAG